MGSQSSPFPCTPIRLTHHWRSYGYPRQTGAGGERKKEGRGNGMVRPRNVYDGLTPMDRAVAAKKTPARSVRMRVGPWQTGACR